MTAANKNSIMIDQASTRVLQKPLTIKKRLHGRYLPNIIRMGVGLESSRNFHLSHHSSMKHFAIADTKTTIAMRVRSFMTLTFSKRSQRGSVAKEVYYLKGVEHAA